MGGGGGAGRLPGPVLGVSCTGGNGARRFTLMGLGALEG